MGKRDIATTNFYFKKIINVLVTQLGNQKRITVDGRHSDAFVFVTAGSCTYTFDHNGHRVTAKEGDILYLAHHAVYEMEIHTKKYASIYCDFTFDSEEERESRVYSHFNPVMVENLFRKLRQCYLKDFPDSFAECMALLYRIYGVIILSEKKNYVGKSVKDNIEEIKKYIDKNFDDATLSVSSLAEKMKVSEVYFRKLFKSQYGISPSQYILSVKLKRAKELMKYPFLTLEECARQSGFSSLQYFCKVFKKEIGISPGKYKKYEKR